MALNRVKSLKNERKEKMLKKSLIAVAVLAIAMPAFAGQLTKIHDWEVNWAKQTLASIDVVACVGYYFFLEDEDAIEVQQAEGKNEFEGCSDERTVETNFAAILYASIKGAIKGTFKVGFSAVGGPSELAIPAGETDIILCVSATKVELGSMTANECNKIATITLQIVPQAAPVICGCTCP